MLPLLRYTLDLFSAEVEQQPQPVAKPAPEPKLGVYMPGAHLQQAIAPVCFVHPQANREARLGDAVVRYAFARGKRRTIGFIIGPEGLAVRAPRWTPLHEVDAALQEKAPWILRKLQEMRERQSRAHSAQVQWRDGVEIPYLGQTLCVHLDPAHGFSGRGAQLQPGDSTNPAPVLRVGLPKAAHTDQIRDAVQAWLMRQAMEHFECRMAHFAPMLGVQWKKLRLSSAGTRWGSASADGSIRLNWRLIHFSPAVVDYVVAHELSHLREMNHSADFWSTVASVVPDYQSLRAQLKEDAVPRW